jgi:hypothetical protein
MEEHMKLRLGWILKAATVVVMVCMAMSAALAQSKAPNSAAASTIKVECNKKGSIGATLAHLTQTGNTRGVTISVTGTCKENITIGAFDHLTIQGSPSATIEDASNGTAPVVLIFSSYDVIVQNFTINGGAPGVNCIGDSYCTLNFNTIQQSAFAGVRFARSHGVLQSNNILNNAGQGEVLTNNSNLVSFSNQIANNGGPGIAVSAGSFLLESGDTIQNNSFGIRVLDNSVMHADTLAISNNRSDGVWLASGAAVSFLGGDIITGNAGIGVAIHDLAYADFATDGSENISGNTGQPDVACYPQFSATRGAGTVGGTTNCVEP